jgi:splicing factor 3B subunit 2
MTKIPFKLPDFIEQTGISKLREQSMDKGKTLKQRMRERMQPKMGKLDVDYSVLHDAFFKNQTKSKLTTHGDVYYEGKEYELRMRPYKPGRLSPELRAALNIPENSPPPWLINMQRYGPPPAYPNLKIPGVNAPLPETLSYGKGRLFTDDNNYTVYADCHGLNKAIYEQRRTNMEYWGALKVQEEEEVEEESEDEEEEAEQEEQVIAPEEEDDVRAIGLIRDEEDPLPQAEVPSLRMPPKAPAMAPPSDLVGQEFG